MRTIEINIPDECDKFASASGRDTAWVDKQIRKRTDDAISSIITLGRHILASEMSYDDLKGIG